MEASGNSMKRSFDHHNNDQPPKRYRRAKADAHSFGPKLVTVFVGEEKQEFVIHEHHLCRYAEYFRNALRRDWEEAEARTINLPTVDPDSFDIYVNWLYTGSFCIKEDTDLDEETLESSGMRLNRELSKWNLCYQLGDYLQDHDFKDFLIDMSIEQMVEQKGINACLAQMIYPFSPARSRHRKFVVDLATHTWGSMQFPQHMQLDQPVEFLKDLICELGSRIRVGAVENMTVREFFEGKSPCEYHDHELDGSLCYRSK